MLKPSTAQTTCSAVSTSWGCQAAGGTRERGYLRGVRAGHVSRGPVRRRAVLGDEQREAPPAHAPANHLLLGYTAGPFNGRDLSALLCQMALERLKACSATVTRLRNGYCAKFLVSVPYACSWNLCCAVLCKHLCDPALATRLLPRSRACTASSESTCRCRYSARLNVTVTTAAVTPPTSTGPPTQGPPAVPAGYSALRRPGRPDPCALLPASSPRPARSTLRLLRCDPPGSSHRLGSPPRRGCARDAPGRASSGRHAVMHQHMLMAAPHRHCMVRTSSLLANRAL